MVTVCAVLSPLERAPLDAAGDGWFETLHAGTLRQAFRAARQRRVDALVVSVQVCRGEAPAVARFMSEFPAIATVALVSQHDSAVSETLLQLGASGVRLAVDCTAPAGWHQLRHLVARPASPTLANSRAASVSPRPPSSLGFGGRGFPPPRPISPACGGCTPPICSRIPACRSRRSRTGSTTPGLSP